MSTIGGKEPRLAGRRQRPATVGIGGEPEWMEWLGEFAAANRMSRQEVLAVAVLQLAERVGFRPPPPRI